MSGISVLGTRVSIPIEHKNKETQQVPTCKSESIASRWSVCSICFVFRVEDARRIGRPLETRASRGRESVDMDQDLLHERQENEAANVMSGECVERRFDGKPCVTSIKAVWRTQRWNERFVADLLPRLDAQLESGIAGWRTQGREECSGGQLYFWICPLMGWTGGLVQFAWCWRSWPSLDRGLVCRDPSSFQGSTVAIVCRPISLCPSYPAASANTGPSCHLFIHSLLQRASLSNFTRSTL